MIGSTSPALGAEAGRWVDIDTAGQTLSVRSAKGSELARFEGIAIGRGGVAAVHYRRDHSTPLGRYRIVAIRRPYVFDTFYELDYPTPHHADLAWQAGRLTPAARAAIKRAAAQHRPPPHGTALGGGIGIHGIGRGDPTVHATLNWTHGCVALSNAQLRDFARWATVGMRVEIR